MLRAILCVVICLVLLISVSTEAKTDRCTPPAGLVSYRATVQEPVSLTPQCRALLSSYAKNVTFPFEDGVFRGRGDTAVSPDRCRYAIESKKEDLVVAFSFDESWTKGVGIIIDGSVDGGCSFPFTFYRSL